MLIIWPNFREAEVLGGRDYAEKTAKKLLDQRDMPHSEQRELAQYLLLLVTNNPGEEPDVVGLILRAVSAVACRLVDGDLWSQAMTSCDGEAAISKLGSDGIRSALQSLPKTVVLPRYVLARAKMWSKAEHIILLRIESLLKNQCSTANRLLLLKMVEESSDFEGRTDWVVRLTRLVLIPTGQLRAEDLETLVTLAHKYGSLDLLRKR